MGRHKSNAPLHRGQRRNVRRVQAASSSNIRCADPCHKVMAYSEREAWAIADMEHATQGGERAKRVYPCRQTPGVWHWTRQESYGG